LGDSAWRREATGSSVTGSFGDFAEAMAFVNRVAEAAEEANHHPLEAANHHPDILLLGWNKAVCH
jgi:pterin-4a-carbinolamine dehydratase